MYPALQLFSTALISVVMSFAVLRALSTPLDGVLRRICPDPPAAAFWVRYTQVMLTAAPLLVVMLVNPFADDRSALEAFRMVLLAVLFGLLVGLVIIGRVVRKFIVAPTFEGRI